MSISVSNRQIIGSVFRGNKFIIPTYQRKYSWNNDDKNRGQIQQLWDDIQEAKGQIKHFFGTLIFKEGVKKGLTESYEIIDGQQRLTTLYLLLSEIIDLLPDKLSDGDKKEDYVKNYLGDIDNLKLTPQSSDIDFLKKLIFSFSSIDPSGIKKRSQILMYEAKLYFKRVLQPYKKNPQELEELIDFIQNDMEVLILNVKNEDEAIKMFSIINDRGLPLTVLDKVKSMLMYFSTRYLNSSLNQRINDTFEIVFDSYDDILIEKNELRILSRFGENAIFTFHYLTTKYTIFKENWNYRNSAETILENFKRMCQDLKNQPDELSKLISSYISDLSAFSNSFRELILKIKNNAIYQYPFQYLEFGATMYPLIIRLYMNGKLDELLPILEKTELRVYKFNTSEPVADIYNLSGIVTANNSDVVYVRDYLNNYVIDRFMSDAGVKLFLSQPIYPHGGIDYLLLRYNDFLQRAESISYSEYKSLQIEHIFSRNPNFSIESHGFESQEEYDIYKNRIGNLTLFETDNSNDVPINKSGKYLTSSVYLTQKLGAEIKKNNGFTIDDINQRIQDITTYCLENL